MLSHRQNSFKFAVIAPAILLLSNFVFFSLIGVVNKACTVLEGKNYIENYVEIINTMNGIDLKNCDNAKATATIPSDLFIPIFVLTRDRVTTLRKSLESYSATFISPFEVIILDHNSTFPEMIGFLSELETKNVSVFHLEEGEWGKALDEANRIIQDYLTQHPAVQFYVFTDPDIAFLRTAHDVLLYYAGLLSSCPYYKVVGPGLQITDIPSHYSKKLSNGQSVYDRHERLWVNVPNIAVWNGVGFHVVEHPIDTTFAMRRRDLPFQRLQRPSLRAYAPYAAVHLDWYDDSDNLPADKVHYAERQSKKRNGATVNNW